MRKTSSRRHQPQATPIPMATVRLNQIRSAIETWALPYGDDGRWLRTRQFGIRRWKTGGAMLISVSEKPADGPGTYEFLLQAMGAGQQAWLVGRAIAVLDSPEYRRLATLGAVLEGYDLNPWWLLVAQNGSITEIAPRWPSAAAKPSASQGDVADGTAQANVLAGGAPAPELRPAPHATFWFPPRQSSMRSDTTP